MGKKTKKRWRTVPIELCSFKPIGRKDNNEETEPVKDRIRITPSPPAPTFNEDEYTKITTPRQDVLFKKGYLGRRKVPNNVALEESAQEHHSQDSVKSDHYVNDSPDLSQMILPSPAYIDPSTVYFINGSGYEVYDPTTGTVTVYVGPPQPQYSPGGYPYLTAIPYQTYPQPYEWYNPQPPPTQWIPPSTYSQRKRFSFDSQNCSAQSSESTGPPSSPQETEMVDDSGLTSQYQYSGYMYPAYHMNGVNPQAPLVETAVHTETSLKRRKQLRKRRRREGTTDGGSESSCEDQCYQSGASVELTTDSKTASDSGVNTHNSGGSTPVNSLPPYASAQLVNSFENLGSPSPDSHLKNFDENDHVITPHISPNDPQTSSTITDVGAAAQLLTLSPDQVPNPGDLNVPVLEEVNGISNGESVDTVDFVDVKTKSSANKITEQAVCNPTKIEAKSSCTGAVPRSVTVKGGFTTENSPTTSNPSYSGISQVGDVDNENKENCDVNANSCSKQDVSNISCNSKPFPKSNLSDSKLVKNNSIHSRNNETVLDSNDILIANDQESNSKVDKNSPAKQAKTSNANAASNSKNQSKKAKSKSKSTKSQQTPSSKQPAIKNVSSEEQNTDNVLSEANNSLKSNKKNKKNQKQSKEKSSQENQGVDTSKESKPKQEKRVRDSVTPTEESDEAKFENVTAEEANSQKQDEDSKSEVDVIERIVELHPSENQCSTQCSALSKKNVESKNEIEFCIDLAISENKNSSCEPKESSVIDATPEDDTESPMELRHTKDPTSRDEQRLLASVITLDQMDDATKELLENDEMLISKFSSCRDMEPKRPPRRKKSDRRLAENVATEVLNEMFEEAVQRVSDTQSLQTPGRITEAVTKWLSENGGVLPPLDREEDEDEESEEENDENLEEESISTDQKNVESNPFPASLHKDDESPPDEAGKRVANANSSAELNNEKVLDVNSEASRKIEEVNTTVRNRLNSKQLETAIEQTRTSNHLNKTDLKIQNSSPLPCGICCNIL